MPVHRDIPAETVASLLETHTALYERNILFDVVMGVGSSRITAARNKAAHEFLKSDKSHLFWIDSDIVWRAKDFMRVLAMATQRDAVIAAYPSKRDPIEFAVNPYGSSEIGTDELGLLPNVGTGLGFACIQRHVMQKLADRAKKIEFRGIDGPAAKIFREDEHEGRDRGEDIAFFADIIELGLTVSLDPTIDLGHHGSKTFRATLSEHLVKLN